MTHGGLIFLLTLTASAGGQALRSPWDGHPVTPTDAPYACPAPPPFGATLSTLEPGTYYVDPHASIIDPQKQAHFQKVTEASTHLSQWAALAADAWLAKGSRAAAACVYSLLDAAANVSAWAGKMPDYSGVYIQNWTLSAVAIAYLKVRESGAGTPAQDAEIQHWFDLLSARVQEFFNAEAAHMGRDKENNHMYWAGLAVAAAAIASNDHDAGSWALNAYKMGVDAIQPDGSLPQELWRGQMTFHYHLYALAPLIMIAELAAANDIDLYSEDDGAIHRLVKLCTAALADPTIFEKRTGIRQIVALPYAGGDIGWAVPYVRRFPNPQLSAFIAKAPWVRYTSWGGRPPE